LIGGVREGALFSTLPKEIRAEHPLVSATITYRPESHVELYELLVSAMPEKYPSAFDHDILQSVVNLFTYHSSVSKEGRASAGLHSTTTGVLSSAHGVSHEHRALMGLILCERWDGELHDSSFLTRLQRLIGDENAWWCKYVGRVAALICAVYPAGVVPLNKPKLLLEAKVKEGLGKRGTDTGIKIIIRTGQGDPTTEALMVTKAIKEVDKLGKRKNWVRDWGLRIQVRQKEDLRVIGAGGVMYTVG
jgi:retrograde regulation protein 2